MSQDFVTQLRGQLREAALREERRAPFAERLVRARRGLPGPRPLAAALAIALLAVAVAIGALRLRGEPEPVKPHVVHSFKVSEGLSSIATGFGAVWVADPIKGEVLRIDPETRRVTKRIAVGGEVRVAAGGGAVWALSGDLLTAGATAAVELVRIDPRSGRIVARIPVRSPGGDNFSPLTLEIGKGGVWVCGAAGALRIDPARNAPDRYVAFRGQPIGVVVEGERVWLLQPGGRLQELDARTGKLVREIRLGETQGDLAPGRPGTLSLVDEGTLTLLDRNSGKPLWRARLGGDIYAWTPDGDDALWVFVSHSVEQRLDELVRLDADTGRPTGRVQLRDEAGALVTRGRDVWVASPGGKILVVR